VKEGKEVHSQEGTNFAQNTIKGGFPRWSYGKKQRRRKILTRERRIGFERQTEKKGRDPAKQGERQKSLIDKNEHTRPDPLN